MFKNFVRDEQGAGVIEYSLIGAVLALGTLAAMSVARDQVIGVFNKLSGALNTAAGDSTSVSAPAAAYTAPTAP